MRSWLALLNRLIVVGTVMGTLAGTAAATTMSPLDLAGLTQRAESVVAGKVTETRSRWTSDHEAIYTEVTIVVDRVLSGAVKVGERVTVRREGGTVDGIGMKVYGAPSFKKDEDVVVFLERRGQARYVVGMSQGKLQLYTDKAGVRRLRRDLSEVAFTGPAPARERAMATLDDLAGAVARLRAAQQRTPAP
jgi:hypothetical protein